MSRSAQRRIVYLVGSYGHGNLGDDLLQEELARMIRSEEQQLEVRALALGAVRFPVPASVPTEGVRLRDPRASLRTVAGALRQARALVIGAGGLISDRYPQVVGALAGLAATARGWGRPVGLIGVGVDRLEQPAAKLALELLGRCAQVITVRDDASRQALPASARVRARVGADLAWGRELEPSAGEGSGVVVSLRPWSGWDRQRLLEQVEAELRARQETHPGEGVSLLPMDLSADPPILRDLAGRIADLSPRLLDPRTPSDADAALAGAAAVLAMRYHAGLLAARQGRPLLLLPYASKVRELASTLVVPSWEPRLGRALHGFSPPRARAVEAARRSVAAHQAALIDLLAEGGA